MSGAELGLVVSVLIAGAVEAVEALTIVLAVGTTRSWPSALSGTGAALLVLAGVIAGLGPALLALPIDALRVVVGVLLLVFGLQWLRKAVLRAAGLKATHDELAIYEHETATAREAGGLRRGVDSYAFAIAFKAVLLEGVEVTIIVLTLGAAKHEIGLAALAAGLAVLLVALLGVAWRAPLATVPENTMKFAVGVLLVSFGLFWGGEGLGVGWPAGEAVLLAIVPVVLLASTWLTLWLRGRPRAQPPP